MHMVSSTFSSMFGTNLMDSIIVFHLVIGVTHINCTYWITGFFTMLPPLLPPLPLLSPPSPPSPRPTRVHICTAHPSYPIQVTYTPKKVTLHHITIILADHMLSPSPT